MEIRDVLSIIRSGAEGYPPVSNLGWEDRQGALALQLSGLEQRVTLRIHGKRRFLLLTVEGHDDEIRKLLRNSLVGLSELRSLPGEHHLLKKFPLDTDAAQVLESAAGWTERIQELLTTAITVSAGEADPPADTILGYWWDSRPNFGDAAGPWLLRAMTGKHVINTRFTQSSGRAVGSIGSLFQMLNRGRLDMWGSGILYPPSEGQTRRLKRLKSVSVHAVRGPKTRTVLQEQIGWEVPEIYGDPALLFPRYYQPRRRRQAEQIAFVPHKHHWKYFKAGLPESVTRLSVADDVETVVGAIVAAGVCISTSLHGIIFAQAYGVPWVWLNVQDDELKGGEFKFEDFFAGLDADAVSRYDVPVSRLQTLDLERVAATASLPRLHLDLDALENAFPLTRKTS